MEQKFLDEFIFKWFYENTVTIWGSEVFYLNFLYRSNLLWDSDIKLCFLLENEELLDAEEQLKHGLFLQYAKDTTAQNKWNMFIYTKGNNLHLF